MNEKSNPTKRREWVKNAAIIFLTIMLVLTFFSNTIMNYSLPEVATEYVQPGTITEKVRGTGNLEATDPYNVIIAETRVISTVAVKEGDEVKKGDPIFYLEDKESTELVDAEKELNTLLLAYQVAVITESLTTGTVNNIENDDTLTLAQKQQKLQSTVNATDKAETTLESANSDVADITKKLGYIGNTVVDTSSEKSAVANAQQEEANANQAASNATANQTRLEQEVKIKENAVTAKETEVANANAAVTSMQDLKSTIINYPDDKKRLTDKEQETGAIFSQLEKSFTDWLNSNPTAGPEQVAKEQKAVNDAKQVYEDAKAALIALDVDFQNATNAYNSAGGDAALQQLQVNAAGKENELAQSKQAVVDANNAVAQAKQDVANKQNEANNKGTNTKNAQLALERKQNSVDVTVDKANASNQLLEAQDKQKRAQEALDKNKANMTDVQKELLAEINLESQNKAIQLQVEKLEKLREKAVGAVIEAPMDGKVTKLSKIAGESTKPDEALAVIQPKGKGFTVSFSATAAQAKKLSVGEVAEVQNAWFYENVKAILSSIKPDPNDPAQKKLLTFSIEGDVQAGQSMSLSIGQKSADYELVVPNSAIREDKNGKFILVVESKSSPLGNRYVATRADVEVLASDDTHTAISAGLYGYEYVVTTATKPVEAGKQVRLAD